METVAAKKKVSKKKQTVKPESRAPDSLFAQLAQAKRSDTQGFNEAWVGLEPTFQSKKSVKKWAKLTAKAGGEDRYFEDKYMLGTLREIGTELRRSYRERVKRNDPSAMFALCELEVDTDPWGTERLNLHFKNEKNGPDFELRIGLDPETFEFGIKPVPLVWFYNERFVRFLDLHVWGVPQALGLRTSMAHGGGQFCFSAKTFLQKSLLADTIAYRLNHPELATWILDYPNCDDRAFRASRKRFQAFKKILDQYWRGAFHPRATGGYTVENAFLDIGFEPACNPPEGVMDARHGPRGDERDVFQTNFGFGRAVRLRAQNVHPGYWQGAHPDEDGYRADQIMRYSEANLNRMQISGEWHVKSGKVIDIEEVAEFDAPLDLAMLYEEASWEMRGQMSRTSADDMVEAILLEAHHAAWLLDNPHVAAQSSILQDQVLMDGEETLRRLAPDVLTRLQREARQENLDSSRGRVKSEWIEPEKIFWAAWAALSDGERAEIAREAIGGFLERVENAASKDPRERRGDPMEAHRHRVHPHLWKALLAVPKSLEGHANLRRELRMWEENKRRYQSRRPQWSVTGTKAPWKEHAPRSGERSAALHE
jgi:hypothetical protein